MKMKGWVALEHKNLDEAFIVQKAKLKNFIQMNDLVWKKYGLNPKDFTYKNVSVKDKKFVEVYTENFPELLL